MRPAPIPFITGAADDSGITELDTTALLAGACFLADKSIPLVGMPPTTLLSCIKEPAGLVVFPANIVRAMLVAKKIVPKIDVVRVMKFAADLPDIKPLGPPPIPKAPPPSDFCNKTEPIRAIQITKWIDNTIMNILEPNQLSNSAFWHKS